MQLDKKITADTTLSIFHYTLFPQMSLQAENINNIVTCISITIT